MGGSSQASLRGKWLPVPLNMLEYSCAFFYALHSLFSLPSWLVSWVWAPAPLGEGQALFTTGWNRFGFFVFFFNSSRRMAPRLKGQEVGRDWGRGAIAQLWPFWKVKGRFMMPFVNRTMDGGTRTWNSASEVGGYGNKWGPWGCSCWWWDHLS